jgi:fluoride exporter
VRYLIHMAWQSGSLRLGSIVVVNIVGSALAGAAIALPESPLTVALIAGFCGALTTFSTVMVQLLPLPGAPALQRRLGLAVLHFGGSVAGCASAFALVTHMA